MAQTISHEAAAQVKPDTLKEVGEAVMSGYQAFRFLAETFGAIEATEVTVKLSSDGAAGLAHMCEKAAQELLDAYGIL